MCGISSGTSELISSARYIATAKRSRSDLRLIKLFIESAEVTTFDRFPMDIFNRTRLSRSVCPPNLLLILRAPRTLTFILPISGVRINIVLSASPSSNERSTIA